MRDDQEPRDKALVPSDRQLAAQIALVKRGIELGEVARHEEAKRLLDDAWLNFTVVEKRHGIDLREVHRLLCPWDNVRMCPVTDGDVPDIDEIPRRLLRRSLAAGWIAAAAALGFECDAEGVTHATTLMPSLAVDEAITLRLIDSPQVTEPELDDLVVRLKAFLEEVAGLIDPSRATTALEGIEERCRTRWAREGETGSLVREYLMLQAGAAYSETLHEGFIAWLERSPAERRQYVHGDDMTRGGLVDWYLKVAR